MAETTNLPPGGYVVDYSQPNPEANEWEAYQYGYMPNAEKFKQYRVERYDPEFGAYVTDIYNADTGQFYATAKGTENKFLDKVVQPIAMAGLTAAIGSAGANLLGLGGAGTGAAGASSAAAGDIAFAAADAAQLAAQGLGEAQIAQTLATTGLDAFVAADMAQLAAQGLSASQIASTVGATAAGTGGGLFNTLSPAQAVAQGVSQFPNAAGAANAAQAAGSAINAPAATAATGTAATSGASGLLSSLTPAQLTSLLNAGVGLLGAGALGSAGGGGGGAVNVGALPQQAPPTYDQGYFDTLNRYYSSYLPGQQADTAMLQSWYNRQPMQTGGAVSGGMGGGLSPAAIQGQQVLGQQSNFNTLFNTLFGNVMGQQPSNTRPATTPVVSSSAPPRLVVGAGDTGERTGPNIADPNDPYYLANQDKWFFGNLMGNKYWMYKGDDYVGQDIQATPENTAPRTTQATEAIQNWWKQNQGKASQEELDRFLTLGYSPELIAQAVPQFSVADLRNAIAGAQQRLQTPSSGYTPERVQNIIEGVQSTAGSASQIQNPFPSAPATAAPSYLSDIQNWYQQNQGGPTENLDKFLATSGYSAEMINQALPQFGVTDLQAAMANARQRLGL